MSPPTVGVLMLVSLALASARAGAAPCGTENLLAGKLPALATEVRGNLAQLTDATVGQEGAQWDAPVVVTLASGTAELTYDLGEARSISALYMQGDANDVYKISGSLDGTPGSFAPIAQFSNVVSAGHGLRSRAVDLSPATLRYLRIGEAAGDGFFSISELAAFCKKPSPFPPAMAAVKALPQTANGVDAQSGWRTFGFMYTAAAMALIALAYRLRKGARPEPPQPATGSDAPSTRA